MHKHIAFVLSFLCFSAFTGCNSYSKIPEGAEVQLASPVGPAHTGPTIVHADMIERLATIRFGAEVGDGFLIVKNEAGEQSALLKSLPQRPGHLRTADILEGQPQINQHVTPATEAQNEEYQKIYPSIAEEN